MRSKAAKKIVCQMRRMPTIGKERIHKIILKPKGPIKPGTRMDRVPQDGQMVDQRGCHRHKEVLVFPNARIAPNHQLTTSSLLDIKVHIFDFHSYKHIFSSLGCLDLTASGFPNK